MDLFENIKIHCSEIMEEYKGCINFLMHHWYPHLLVIVYSKNLIKNKCVALITKA